MMHGGRLVTGFIIASGFLGCDSNRYVERVVPQVLATTSPSDDLRPAHELRVSVAAMLSPSQTHAAYSDLFRALGTRIGRRILLVQRRTYREVNDLLLDGQIDVALLCTGGYLEVERRSPGAVEVLAVPTSGGKATYQSLVIVPATSEVTTLDELRGRRFAFTDQLSLTGRAYIVHHLRAKGEDPGTFFDAPVLTQSHDRSVLAVANRLVEGAAVDSLVYEHMLRESPELRAQTRIIHRSPDFGIPPVVAATTLRVEVRQELRAALLALGSDPVAAAALRRIGLDGFAMPTPTLYDEARRVAEAEP